jgi:hypothetical protein
MTVLALTDSINRSRGMVNSIEDQAIRLKQAGALPDITPGASFGFGDHRESGAQRERYGQFRGWVYSAINALASEGAGQGVQVAKMNKAKGKPGSSKALIKTLQTRMPGFVRRKSAEENIEILQDHFLVDFLDQPNPIQGRWQFVYSFIANLCLTGWSYVVGGFNEENQLEVYSLPTTWIKPDHTEGPFTRFKIVNPKNPTAEANSDWLTRENVAFAYLPNPADPMSAYAPAQSQGAAIRIDDRIQLCQEKFFENGVFPSVVVTMGREAHPDVPGGVRPRLNAVQRRQVTGAIKKVMAGIANYGNPAIVDGLIESIERLGASQNEIGWEKSEGTIRTRILSALSVHPYILGEPVGVGGYAQVVNIEKRFFKRVNTCLDMLSTIATNFVAPMAAQVSPETKAKKKKTKNPDKLLAWWEECIPIDPSLRWSNLNAARGRGDVSRNEIRVELGLPPDETGGDRTKTFTSGDVSAVVAIQGQVAQGIMEPEQARAMLEIMFDLDPEDAARLAGKKTVQEEQVDATQEQTQELHEAKEELKKAIKLLEKPIQIPALT